MTNIKLGVLLPYFCMSIIYERFIAGNTITNNFLSAEKVTNNNKFIYMTHINGSKIIWYGCINIYLKLSNRFIPLHHNKKKKKKWIMNLTSSLNLILVSICCYYPTQYILHNMLLMWIKYPIIHTSEIFHVYAGAHIIQTPLLAIYFSVASQI